MEDITYKYAAEASSGDEQYRADEA